MATGIGGTHSSNIQSSQTNYWGDPTRAEDNTCVIICCFRAKKPVRQNQEKYSPTELPVRHFGCICVLPDVSSDRPDPRGLRSNIPTLTETTTRIQNAGPNNKTSKSYTRKDSNSYPQADRHTSEHSHRPTDFRRIFLPHAVQQVIRNS